MFLFFRKTEVMEVKERKRIIFTGLGILLFSIAGLWEYMQMQTGFDVPQTVVVMPVVGMLCAVCLQKSGFIVPVCTIVISVVFQMVSGEEFKQIVINSKINTILNLLPYIIIFEMLGMAGGFLIRVIINRKKPVAAGIICGIAGLFLTFGSGVLMYGNPLYPFLARQAVTSCAKKYDTGEYKISQVIVSYSMEDMEYQGKVVMSDGVIYALYHSKETGEVTAGTK